MSFWSGAGSGVVGGLFDLAGGLASSALSASYNADAMADQYYYNQQLAAQQNLYNTTYAKNKIQWQVQDLKKAGLNPLLAAGGSLTGGTASAGLPSVSALQTSAPNLSSIGTNAISAYMQAKALDSEVKQKDAQTTKTKVDTYVDAAKGVGSLLGPVAGAKVLKGALQNHGSVSPDNSVGSSAKSSVVPTVGLGSKFLRNLGIGALGASTAYGAGKMMEKAQKEARSQGRQSFTHHLSAGW